MNLKLSLFALLVIFSAMANKSLARTTMETVGNGAMEVRDGVTLFNLAQKKKMQF